MQHFFDAINRKFDISEMSKYIASKIRSFEILEASIRHIESSISKRDMSDVRYQVRYIGKFDPIYIYFEVDIHIEISINRTF